jgi:glycosyltransferase involved in cell wall biosynthesis
MDLSIIMPAFNEEATILEAVQAALDAELPVAGREVVVVENGSHDRTRELLHSRDWPPEVKIVEIDVNRGKGGAVRLGVEHAAGKYVAVLDADLEYDPNDYATMLPPLEDGFDAVLGTRYWQSHSAFGYWYVIGNKAISTAANMMFNSYLSDCMVGMKVLPRELFRSLGLTENGFGFDAEVVARLLRRKARIYEVPVHYRARSRDEGKKLRASDGLRMLKVFLKCRFS